MTQQRVLTRAPTSEELARRQSVIARILIGRKKRMIAPLTSADLVHQAREGAKPSVEIENPA